MRLLLGVLLILIIVAGCKAETNNPGNSALVEEVDRIQVLARTDENGKTNITAAELDKIKGMFARDVIALSYIDKLEWLIEKNESEHLLHVTGFLREYAKTGQDKPCFPHELWHIALIARHGEVEHAFEHAEGLEEKYSAWEKDIDEKRKAYPRFFGNLDEVKKEGLLALERIRSNDMGNETLSLMEKTGQEGPC